jgi:hypothetical protein
MKTIDETMNILSGSKRYDFGYNENGMMSVLTVTDYYTGESVSLDLSRLTPEMLDELQVEDSDNEDYEY